MGTSDESGLGKFKLLVGLTGTIAAAVGAVTRLDDRGHVMLAAILFAFLALYVVVDVLWWRGHPAVWLFGPLTAAAGGYWLLGFASLHGVPAAPLLPAAAYPPPWGYIALFGWVALYAAWDVVDAKANQYRDEGYLVGGAGAMLVGAAICLVLTLRGPQGG